MTTFQPFFRIIDKKDPNKVYYNMRRFENGRVLVTSSNHNMMFEKETPTDVIVKFIVYKLSNHISDDVSLKVVSDIGVTLDLTSPDSNSTYEDLTLAVNIVKHLDKVQEFNE